MAKEGTKAAAEAVLCELPSVIGAFVREDVNGHPREVHVLVKAGPNPRRLAYDIRDLLEERLGVPVDQRVISIAQLAPGRVPGPWLAERVGIAVAPSLDDVEPEPDDAYEEEPDPIPDARVRFTGLTIDAFDNRVRVNIALGLNDAEYSAEEEALDTVPARLRAAAMATLRAVDQTCTGRARFEVEHVSQQRAFERDYVLVSALVSSPFLGRKAISLVGAQPVEYDIESAAVLAALKAVNRTLALVLRLTEGTQQDLPRRLLH